jgi:N-acetylneuraminic acid mutarotase
MALRARRAYVLAAVLVLAALPLFASAADDSSETVAAWTKLNPSGPPSVRSGHAFAALPSTGRILAFGGCDGGKLADTWELDPANGTWTNRTSGGGPPKRYAPGMAHDPASRRTILFGGAGPDVMNDTWSYNASSGAWTDRAPAARPLNRQEHMMALAPVARRMILFGGSDGAYNVISLNDTWSYDVANNTWTDLKPAVTPPGRTLGGFIHVGPGDRMMLYGGWTSSGRFGDLWFYQLENNTWWKSTNSTPPGARRAPGLVLDARHGLVVMFGGLAADYASDTWTYNRTTGAWSNITPPSSPPGRSDHAMAFDPSTGKIAMFGGRDNGAPGIYMNDAWLLDLSATVPGVSVWIYLPGAAVMAAALVLLGAQRKLGGRRADAPADQTNSLQSAQK